MFFPEKIKSIQPTDKVLEVGPGGTPYYRSDIFLEKNFDKDELKRQSGNTPELITNKPIVYYDGGIFPFKNDEFDYVICSHVLEHVPTDSLELFASELQRVAKKGYLEFPALHYDFVYNIKEHLNLMNLDNNNCILYMAKDATELKNFSDIQKLFLISLENGYVDLVNDLKDYFFVGFEWDTNFEIKRASSLKELISNTKHEEMAIPLKTTNPSSCYSKLRQKIKKIFSIRLTNDK